MRVLLFIAIAALSGCATLPDVRSFSAHTVQLADAVDLIETFVNRAYLPILANEQSNLEGMAEILNDRYREREPLRARELLEIIKQQNANLAERRTAAAELLKAVIAMVEAHASLLHEQKMQLALIKDYGRRINAVRKKLHATF